MKSSPDFFCDGDGLPYDTIPTHNTQYREIAYRTPINGSNQESLARLGFLVESVFVLN